MNSLFYTEAAVAAHTAAAVLLCTPAVLGSCGRSFHLPDTVVVVIAVAGDISEILFGLLCMSAERYEEYAYYKQYQW